MTLNRCFRNLAAVALVLLLGAPALAEDDDLSGLQLFAPAEVSRYGRGTMPNEGYFICLDGLYWAVSAPNVKTIGLPRDQFRTAFYSTTQDPNGDFIDFVDQNTTVDTSPLHSIFQGGGRVEFGRVIDHHGWMVSTYQVSTQNQGFIATNATSVFLDPVPVNQGIIGTDAAGNTVVANLPMTFTSIEAFNRTVTWSVELEGIYRSRELHNGGFLEFLYGARYLELNEDFSVAATGGFTSTPLATDAGASSWFTRAENHIIGPQIGLRYFHKMQRWMFNAEGRFMAGYNRQNVRQEVTLGDGLPGVVGSTGFPWHWPGNSSTHRTTFDEFTPLVELRLELRYQVTRAFTLRAGWTGMWMDNMARGSAMVDYTLPQMGIAGNNRQDVFVQGLTFGVDFNR